MLFLHYFINLKFYVNKALCKEIFQFWFETLGFLVFFQAVLQ